MFREHYYNDTLLSLDPHSYFRSYFNLAWLYFKFNKVTTITNIFPTTTDHQKETFLSNILTINKYWNQRMIYTDIVYIYTNGESRQWIPRDKQLTSTGIKWPQKLLIQTKGLDSHFTDKEMLMTNSRQMDDRQSINIIILSKASNSAINLTSSIFIDKFTEKRILPILFNSKENRTWQAGHDGFESMFV